MNEQTAKSNPTTCCVRIHMHLKFLFVIQFVRTYMTYFRVKYDDAVNVYLNGQSHQDFSQALAVSVRTYHLFRNASRSSLVKLIFHEDQTFSQLLLLVHSSMSSTRSLSALKIFITLHHGKSKSNPHPPEKNNPYQKKFGVLLYIRAIEERN